ncbi:MAG TPA: Spy/CpxP family protein refolding chaperone [Ramlibacter sp.]|nr:Spy/CpxP family protein refolding chaperone [Ramlibacter sp.]
MKHRHLLAATLLAAAGFGAIAQAQPQMPPAGGPGQHQMRGDHGRMDPARMEQFRAQREQRRAQRLAELKQKLQITGAQENAWNTWANAMKPGERQRPDRAQFERMTTPERIDALRALRAQRNAAMDRRMDATKNFYATLSAEQKRTFDAESGRFMGGKGGHGRHHRG